MADKFTIAEEAYKNGYEQGKKDAMKHGKPKPHFMVVKGKSGNSVETYWKANKCPFCYDTRIARFCSNCGAKMDWEEVENAEKCTDN